MDKPFSEWTLAEIKSHCLAKSECKDCIFLGENLCEFRNTPSLWPLNEMETKTSAIEASDKPAKPRLAEVLGVEVGEQFRVPGNGGTVTFWVTDAGYFDTDPPHLAGSTYMLLNAINHPESIIRAPRLTEAELERCRVYGAKYLTRDKCSSYVILHGEKPKEIEPGYFGLAPYIGEIKCELFQSVRPGDCICVEEAQHDA